MENCYNGHIVGISTSNGVSSFRVLLSEYNEKTGKWKFSGDTVSEGALIKAMRDRKVNIQNADIVNGKLHGTTGSLSRFTPKVPIKNKPVVIISEIRLVGSKEKVLGYRVTTSSGVVKSIKLDSLISYCRRVNREAKLNRSDACPIQNAVYVPESDGVKDHIKPYVDGQFFVEYISVKRQENVVSANVTKDELDNRKRQLERIQEIFTKEQIRELNLGKSHGVSIRIYANPKFEPEQMKEIRLALESKLDPRPYAMPNFSASSMRAYRIIGKYDIDIEKFINPKYNSGQIFEICTALIDGVDISKIANPNMNQYDMAKIRVEEAGKIWTTCDVSVIDLIKTVNVND